MHGHEAVDRTVFDDEHERQIGITTGLATALAAMHDTLASWLGGVRGNLRQPELEPEPTPAARLAFGPDRPAHQLDQLLGDRESEPVAPVLAGCRDVGLHERLKHALEAQRLDTDAAVDDLE